MSRTDKDQPWKFDPNKKGPFTDSNFRRGRKALKREGNKRARRNAFSERYAGRCPFYGHKTVRTNNFFY